jgi:dTDP-L-rhamnose 4-epimerase
MAQALAAAFPLVDEPVVTGEFRLGDVRHVFAATDRATELLGFTAGEDFSSGMIELARAPARARI